jgi:hypothetical protein
VQCRVVEGGPAPSRAAEVDVGAFLEQQPRRSSLLGGKHTRHTSRDDSVTLAGIVILVVWRTKD